MPGVPPVPIPNTAVKPRAADGSRTIGPARVGRCQVYGPVCRKTNRASFLSELRCSFIQILEGKQQWKVLYHPYSMIRTISNTSIAIVLSLILQSSGFAQVSRMEAGAADSDNVGIAVEQLGVLVYPSSMLYNGVDSGEVRAAISVDSSGKLTDCLVTAYTTPEFAEAAFSALKRWRYQPALSHGRPVASRSDLIFEFRNKGVTVQTLPGAMLHRVYFDLLNEHYSYKPAQLRDLDRIPTPVHVVTPMANPDDQAHSVTVGFYIDEEGKVRMPAVDRDAADDLFAAAAVAAVEQWRFEPPLCKGRSVLVSVQQKFHFRPKK
jgi:TonB family protein